MLRLIYSRKTSISSLLIRIAGWWGPWSHCGIIDGDEVIESRALEGGVICVPLAEMIKKSSEYEIVEVECPNPEAGIKWARSTIGLPYDWGGVFGILFKRYKWQKDDHWYCSEHVERAITEAGRVRFRTGRFGISPNQSFFVR